MHDFSKCYRVCAWPDTLHEVHCASDGEWAFQEVPRSCKEEQTHNECIFYVGLIIRAYILLSKPEVQKHRLPWPEHGPTPATNPEYDAAAAYQKNPGWSDPVAVFE